MRLRLRAPARFELFFYYTAIALRFAEMHEDRYRMKEVGLRCRRLPTYRRRHALGTVATNPRQKLPADVG